MENPIKMDHLGGKKPLFLVQHPIDRSPPRRAMESGSYAKIFDPQSFHPKAFPANAHSPITWEGALRAEQVINFGVTF